MPAPHHERCRPGSGSQPPIATASEFNSSTLSNSGKLEEKSHHGAYQLNDKYDPAAIEARWKARWAADGLDDTPDDTAVEPDRPKFYVLEFFPYPSGSGLTVGHLRNYVPSDVIARTRRRQGFDVLHPMGWDAFGLPAENEARLHGRHPAVTTRAYAANYRRQLELASCSYDWSREIFSSESDYYRWTQWIFLLLYRRGLAYRSTGDQWWCPTCATVLANEQVTEVTRSPGQYVCWRGHGDVCRREVNQWFLRITAYADRLLADLDGLDWPDGIVAQQRNWIGRVEDRGTGVGCDTSAEMPDAPIASTVTYHLRDWSVSRQRFWGAPIPIIYCQACGAVPVPDEDLPVRLPDVDTIPAAGLDPDGRPTSPLVNIPAFVHTTCPACGGPARRDTDTLDGFACSSWYFLRFTSPDFTAGPFDPQAVARWMPVDLYVGGAEHAVMHLLYARFWTKVLFDAGLIAVSEPFKRLQNQGMILDASGGKMSKSRPEYVVTPDEAVARHGADAVRAYLLFIAPFDQDVVWQDHGIAGIVRWLRRIWRLAQINYGGPTSAVSAVPGDGPEAMKASNDDPADVLRRATHQTIRDVSNGLDDFRFNSVVARLMTFSNTLTDWVDRDLDREGVPNATMPQESTSFDPSLQAAWDEAVDALLLLLAPICPHIAEELWARRGRPYSIHQAPWPTHDAALAATATVEIAVQVDGVLRDRIDVPIDADEAAVRALALASAAVVRWLDGRSPKRIVVITGKVVNLVTKK